MKNLGMMTMPEIPNGWEACSVEECTHALLAGETVARLAGHMDNLSFIPFDVYHIWQNVWQPLGITPLRKVEINPIEFDGIAEFVVTHYADNHGHESPRGHFVVKPTDSSSNLREGMKFKLVQVLD